MAEQSRFVANADTPLPNFLVLGAQKSGTSWLHKFFLASPDIFVPAERKELFFFDNRKRFQALGIEGYRNYFTPYSGQTAVGEVASGYLSASGQYGEWGKPSAFVQHTPERVKTILGKEVKLIVLLRNPIDRAISAFMHHKRVKRVSPEQKLNECWHQWRIVHLGFYAAHLAEWRKRFDDENFWIVTYETFFEDAATRSDLHSFLSGRPNDGGALIKRRVYRGLEYSRDVNGVFDENGQQLATKEDIDLLRSTFAADVKRLAAEWSINLERWHSDFDF